MIELSINISDSAVDDGRDGRVDGPALSRQPDHRRLQSLLDASSVAHRPLMPAVHHSHAKTRPLLTAVPPSSRASFTFSVGFLVIFCRVRNLCHLGHL